LSGEQGGARGRTHRCSRDGLSKVHASPFETIEVGRAHIRVAGKSKSLRSPLVSDDKQNVGRRVPARAGINNPQQRACKNKGQPQLSHLQIMDSHTRCIASQFNASHLPLRLRLGGQHRAHLLHDVGFFRRPVSSFQRIGFVVVQFFKSSVSLERRRRFHQVGDHFGIWICRDAL